MDNFIKVYKNVFDDKFCKDAISWMDTAEKEGFIRDRQTHDGAPKVEKEDTSTYLPETSFDMNHTCNDLMGRFNYVFWEKCYKDYADTYGVIHTLRSHQCYTMKIQKTKPGQGYHVWHCETTSRETSNRLLAWTVYLNDEFEAGETEFLYQQYRYKPSKGDVVIFPTAFTHTHRGNPPIGGDKYIITGWVEF
jgi:hypothetical protein